MEAVKKETVNKCFKFSRYISCFCLVVIFFLAFLIKFALIPGTAYADDGRAFDAPSRVAPDRGKEISLEHTGEQEVESPDGTYRVEAGQAVNVYRNSDDALLLSEGFTNAHWGFSPDEHRFVIHFFGGQDHQDTVKLYNLEDASYNDPPVWPTHDTTDADGWNVDWSNLAFSKDGKNLSYIGNSGSDYYMRVVESETGDVKVSKTISGTVPQWGFSPDEDSFIIHRLRPSDGSHMVDLYNLEESGQNNESWSSSLSNNGSIINFSRNGNYLLYTYITGSNKVNMRVVETSTGNVRYESDFNVSLSHNVDLKADDEANDTDITGDGFNSANWGFSRDSEDSVFVYAYVDTNNSVQWRVFDLDRQEDSVGFSLGQNSAFWRTCRYGDAVGLVNAEGSQIRIRLFRVSDGEKMYDGTHPAYDVEFRTTDTHYIAMLNDSTYMLATREGEPPEIPSWPEGSELSFEDLQHDSVTVSWPDVTEEMNVLEYSVFLDGEEVKSVEASVFSYTSTGLDALSEYTFGVEFIDEEGTRSERLGKSVTTPSLLPPSWPEDTELTATLVEGGCPPFQVLLEWTAALENINNDNDNDEATASAYKIYQDGSLIDTIEVEDELEEIKYFVQGLETGIEMYGNYNFKIEAGDELGSWSEDGPEVNIQMEYRQPPCWYPDAELVVSDIGVKSVSIHWPQAVQADYVDRYEYYRSYTYMGEIYTEETTPEDGVFSSDIEGLHWDTEYTFRVVAFDEEDNFCCFLESETVKTLDSNKFDPPKWPTGSELTAVDEGSTELTLQWTEAEDEFEGEETEVGYYQVFLGDIRIDTISGSKTTYTVTDLRPGQEYNFSVQAGDDWENWTDDGPSLTVTTHLEPPEAEIIPETELAAAFPYIWDQWDHHSIFHGPFGHPTVSADDNYIAFTSRDEELAQEAGATGTWKDIRQVFVYNRHSEELEIVSINNYGTLGDDHSYTPAISKDGRYVTFASEADNLDPRAEDLWGGLYVHDRQSSETKMASIDLFGRPFQNVYDGLLNPPAISADGQRVVFGASCEHLGYGLWMHDLIRGRTEPVDRMPSGERLPDAGGYYGGEKPSISEEGRYVSFTGFTFGGNIYVYDCLSGRMITAYEDDGLVPDMNSDGNVLVFETVPVWDHEHDEGDKYELFVHDVETGQTESICWASTSEMGWGYNEDKGGPAISDDGRYLVFSSEDPGLDPCTTRFDKNVYVYDRWEESFELVSYFPSEDEGMYSYGMNPSISGDGQIIVFENMAYDMINIFYHKQGNVDIRPPCWSWENSLDSIEVGDDYALLQWDSAVDNVGVTAYRLYKDGDLVQEIEAEENDDGSGIYQLEVTGLVEDEEYTFKVEAGDEAGNWSTHGPSEVVVAGAKYNLSFHVEPEDGGTAVDETGEDSYSPGDIIEIKATPAEGYEFTDWSSPEGEFDDAASQETTFVMPNKDVTVTANFWALPVPHHIFIEGRDTVYAPRAGEDDYERQYTARVVDQYWEDMLEEEVEWEFTDEDGEEDVSGVYIDKDTGVITVTGEVNDEKYVIITATSKTDHNVENTKEIFIEILEGCTAVVYTEEELHDALLNEDITTIIFDNDFTTNIFAERLINFEFDGYALTGNIWVNTEESGVMTIEGWAYPETVTGDLLVNAPNATVYNYILVGGEVIIEDISQGTWYERADGNDMLINIESEGNSSVVLDDLNNLLVKNSGGGELSISVGWHIETAIFLAPVSVSGGWNIGSAYIGSEGVELDYDPWEYIYSLSLISEPEGSGTTEGEGYYGEGEEVEIKALAVSDDSGFIEWSYLAGMIDDKNSQEAVFTMPGEDVVVTAHFESISRYIVSISEVNHVEVSHGTEEADAISALDVETTITDSNDLTHAVELTWSIEDYDGQVAGDYIASGSFELPEGIEQPDPPLDLKVNAIVTVAEPDLEYSSYSFAFEVISPIEKGQDVEMDVTFESIDVKDLGYEDVRFKFSKESGPGDVYFAAEDTEGEKHEFVNQGYWGPAGGFYLSPDYSATTNWVLNFSEAGEYTITFSLIEASDGDVIAGISDSVTIEVIKEVVSLPVRIAPKAALNIAEIILANSGTDGIDANHISGRGRNRVQLQFVREVAHQMGPQTYFYCEEVGEEADDYLVSKAIWCEAEEDWVSNPEYWAAVLCYLNKLIDDYEDTFDQGYWEGVGLENANFTYSYNDYIMTLDASTTD